MGLESFLPKCVSFCCFAMLLAIQVTFMVKYKALYNNAVTYDSVSDTIAYDQCGFLTVTTDAASSEIVAEGTGWTQVFHFNMILYKLYMTMTILSCFCIWIPAFMILGLGCMTCLGFPLFAAVILAGIRRLNSVGDLCAASTEVSSLTDGTTFADDAASLKALFIAQCALHIPMLCCIYCGVFAGLGGEK